MEAQAALGGRRVRRCIHTRLQATQCAGLAKRRGLAGERLRLQFRCKEECSKTAQVFEEDMAADRVERQPVRTRCQYADPRHEVQSRYQAPGKTCIRDGLAAEIEASPKEYKAGELHNKSIYKRQGECIGEGK